MAAFPDSILAHEAAVYAQSTRRLPSSHVVLESKQLSWIRLNVDSFRHAEDQCALLHYDVVRAARIAGLIGH